MVDSGSRGRPGLFTTFLTIACLGLAVLVVLLARQNQQLKRRIESPGPAVPESALHSGDALGSLVLLDGSGGSEPLSFGGGEAKTLLLVFSPDCPACDDVRPRWDAALESVSDPTIRVLGIQVDGFGGSGSAAAAAMPFAVYGVDRSGSDALGRIPFIPATLLLDGEGNVEEAWYGVLTPGQSDELRSALATESRLD